MFPRILSLALLTTLAAGALSSSAAAQCAHGPDGLSGPCWVPTNVNLPQFPGATLPGTAICWDKCDPQPQQCTRVSMATPQRITCSQFTMDVRVDDCFGNNVLGGTMHLDYTRTWDEVDANGDRKQVYRLLAKVDMRAATLGNACMRPNCFNTYQHAFYYGYVDYAYDCATGQVETVIALYHACDYYIHRQQVSSTPGSFHPDTSFAIVAPSTAANPFVAANITPPSGPITAEATRNQPLGAGAACITEDPVVGDIAHLAQGCACPLQPQPAQLTLRRVVGEGLCTTATGKKTRFFSINATPSLPWYHDMVTSIGSWTTDVSYPGKEQLWMNEGAFFFSDLCSAQQGNGRKFGEIYYGMSTSEGWGVVQSPVGQQLSQNFTDLAANFSFKPGQISFPMAGMVLPTRNLLYVNTP